MSRQVGLTLPVAAAAALLASVAHAQVDVQSASLVALYRFDEGSGTVAVDSATNEGIQSANQNQGTIGWTDDGLIGGALDLPGGASLQAPDAIREGATAFTISAWVNNRNASPGYDGIYMARDENWGLAVEGGDAAALHYDYRYDNDPGGGSVGTDSDNGSALLDTWQHIAMTWTADGSFRDIYLNGVDIGDGMGSADIYTGHLSTWNIGDDPCCGGREINAQLDELAVWDVALTAGEIQTIYDSGLQGIGLAEPPPVGIAGDVTGEGDVNGADFEIIRQNFLTEQTERTAGDLINDDFIDFSDYGQWKQADKTPGALGAPAAAAPEPSAVLLLVSLAGLVGCSRRS